MQKFVASGFESYCRPEVFSAERWFGQTKGHLLTLIPPLPLLGSGRLGLWQLQQELWDVVADKHLSEMLFPILCTFSDTLERQLAFWALVRTYPVALLRASLLVEF